jgi:hypothetical protein
MSTFTKRVEHDVTLLECDLCGAKQIRQLGEPLMEEFKYIEVLAGSHGHDYTQERVLHLCKRHCHNRIGQIISVLKTRRSEPEWAKAKFEKLLEILDKLLEKP